MIQSYRRATPLTLLVLALLGGCTKAPEEKSAAAETKVAATPARLTQSAVVAQNIENTQTYADLHKPFKEATFDEKPDKVSRHPDETAAGKKTAELLRQIRGENGTGGLWEQIRFLTPQGKRISYEAVVKTDAGEFNIELLPDVAPNHVRNFIALARAGYYDGLGIDYILKQVVEEQTWTVLLAGCPLGTGEAGHGSIGYWLKREITGKCTHEEGTVGAWPVEESLENTACKFYINLTKASWMDPSYTVFGRICKGLDVVRKISRAPQQKDDKGMEIGYPQDPIILQSVTIVQKTEE
jgi:cyclophilin family peptidyl-prolyl cis-trans isomerase